MTMPSLLMRPSLYQDPKFNGLLVLFSKVTEKGGIFIPCFFFHRHLIWDKWLIFEKKIKKLKEYNVVKYPRELGTHQLRNFPKMNRQQPNRHPPNKNVCMPTSAVPALLSCRPQSPSYKIITLNLPIISSSICSSSWRPVPTSQLSNDIQAS